MEQFAADRIAPLLGNEPKTATQVPTRFIYTIYFLDFDGDFNGFAIFIKQMRLDGAAIFTFEGDVSEVSQRKVLTNLTGLSFPSL